MLDAMANDTYRKVSYFYVNFYDYLENCKKID